MLHLELCSFQSQEIVFVITKKVLRHTLLHTFPHKMAAPPKGTDQLGTLIVIDAINNLDCHMLNTAGDWIYPDSMDG